jgi:hypothetical protein
MDNPSLTQKCSRHDCKNLIPICGSKTCERCKVTNKRNKAAQRARNKANLVDTNTEKQVERKRGADNGLEKSARPAQRQKTQH